MVGSKTRLAQPKLPEGIWTVTELTAGTAFTWTSTSPGVRVTASHVDEPSAEGSLLTLDVDLAGWLAPAGWLMTRSLTQRYVKTEAAAIRPRTSQADPACGAHWEPPATPSSRSRRRAATHTVRQADRPVPTHPAKARRHGPGIQKGTLQTGRLKDAGRLRPEPAAPRTDLLRQTQQRSSRHHPGLFTAAVG